MSPLKPLAIAAALAATVIPAQAGDNSCTGVIQANGVIDTTMYMSNSRYGEPGWDQWPQPQTDECRFDPKSTIGKRILAKCPIGSTCNVRMPLEYRGKTIGKIENVEKW